MLYAYTARAYATKPKNNYEVLSNLTRMYANPKEILVFRKCLKLWHVAFLYTLDGQDGDFAEGLHDATNHSCKHAMVSK